MSVPATTGATQAAGGENREGQRAAGADFVPGRYRRETRPSLHRICALALGLMLVGTAPATAQELTLRSGEHGDFTRLTLPLPEEAGWQLGRSQWGYVLVLDNTASRLDLSNAFARIGQDRIAALRPPDRASGQDDDRVTWLAIDLACSCHMLAFEDANGLLVLDIHDGPPAPDAPFETPIAADTGGRQNALPLRDAVQPHTTRGYDWVSTGLNAGALYGDRDGHALREEGLVLPDFSGLSPPQTTAAQSAARMMLQRNFARAQDQGLFGLTAPDWDTSQPGPRRAPAPGLTLPPQINVETALDREQRNRAADDPRGALPAHPDCPAPDDLNVASWGPEGDGFATVSRLRSRLLGEFDRPEPERLAALVRGYLHLGFGAEARAKLAAFPGVLEDAEILDALGNLIDGDTPTRGNPFHAMAECGGPSALWAVLSRDRAEVTQPFNSSAVISAFSALPLHLRRHLGPRLAERLLAADAIEAAEAVRSAIDRASGGNGADLEMIAAEIDLAEGRRSAALDRLARLAQGSSPHAPVALAIQAETRLDADEGIGEPMARAIAAEAVTHRGTPLGKRLARLEVLGLASAGRYGEAFAARDRELHRSTDPAPGLTEALFAIVIEQADDIEFLARAFSESAWHDGRFGQQARLALAERFLDLGFPQSARLALAPAQDASTRERHLHARAALALEEPAEALRLIAGVRGEAAADLRGTVLTRLGDHRAASHAFRAAEAHDAMIRAAWLAGDDETISRHGTELQRMTLGLTTVENDTEITHPRPAAPDESIATLPGAIRSDQDDTSGASGTSAATDTQEQGPLQRGRALLERSDQMRARLENLLNSYPAP